MPFNAVHNGEARHKKTNWQIELFYLTFKNGEYDGVKKDLREALLLRFVTLIWPTNTAGTCRWGEEVMAAITDFKNGRIEAVRQ